MEYQISNLDARTLAERLKQWSTERIGIVELALRLACADRVTLDGAYRILHDEIRTAAEQDVDEFMGLAPPAISTAVQRASSMRGYEPRGQRGFTPRPIVYGSNNWFWMPSRRYKLSTLIAAKRSGVVSSAVRAKMPSTTGSYLTS